MLTFEFIVQPVYSEPPAWNVDAWAVILEMNNFPEGWTSFPSMNFTNSKRMVKSLKALGWPEDHVYVKLDNLSLSVVQQAVEWLVDNVQAGDIALFYIFTHGNWMRYRLMWNEWFPHAWKEVNTSRKILIVDTCFAGEFIESIRDDPSPHVSLAHCASDELAWAGIPEEGLPIIGSVWNYHFANALTNASADLNRNGFVSVEEAFEFSTPLVQKYYNETVFAVPEYLEMFHDWGIYPEEMDAYPHPIMDDQYPNELHLDLRYYGLLTDLNRDGIVNILDITIVARAFGTRPGDENWNAIADLNDDEVINIIDISMVARDFGKSV